MRLPFGTGLSWGLAGLASAGSLQPPPAGEPVSVTMSQAEIAGLPFATAGKAVLGKRVRDSLGEHVLLLTEKASASPNGRIEHIELLARYYDRTGDNWNINWTIRDGVDCPELDGAASLFPRAASITDLDRNGQAEVTVAYKTFCGGGVDPSTVKVILRQGKQKFAIRGESLLLIKGQEPMGGTNKPDKALLENGNAAFRRHMDIIWQQVRVERNNE
jgi:hypothetical protein